MWSALMAFLFIIATVLLVSSRRSIRELCDANAEAYRSGFMAGHVRGWNDCATAASVQRAPSMGLPAVAASVRATAWASRPSAADAPDDASVDLSAWPLFQPVELSSPQPSDAAYSPTGVAASPSAGPATDETLVTESAEEMQARKERRERTVLAYLSLTFVVSTAWSGVSVLGAPLVWYFAVMIAFAVAAVAAAAGHRLAKIYGARLALSVAASA